MQSSRHVWWWGMIGIAVLLAAFLLIVRLVTTRLQSEDEVVDTGKAIGVVAIEGVISSELTERTVRQLSKYGDDPSIKAIVLRINSPGGGVAASQEIYEEVKRIRSAGKLVVASMGSVAASGGYYVASIADHIFASAGTVTGSIGVIVQLANASQLLHKLGIESTAITSGPFKDSGNPTRPLSPEERQVFQGLVDDVYQQFIEAVALGRKLPLDEVRQAADGRIYTGRQAKELRLIDELGSLHDAIRYTAERIGMSGKPRLVQERKERLWWLRFFMDSVGGTMAWDPFSRVEAVLQYRWRY
jgi:protease-4